MRKTLILIIFIWTSLLSKSQSKLDSILNEVEKENKEIFFSRIYSIKNTASNIKYKTYQNQGANNSTYLILKSDSSFVYYTVYEVGFDLSLGKWTEFKHGKILLNWDRKKTIDATKDKNQYQKYFAYSSPLPLSITNWIVKRNGEKLEPFK
ncbi:hypothetical protein ACFOWM_13820 [Ferruginibacter yonginensis]|uniref:Uncharacterized protein n=1 Tax=Ferruginibacter yonginensis TaxID=1310416 RepID=A0ABV8QUW1_9BACT